MFEGVDTPAAVISTDYHVCGITATLNPNKQRQLFQYTMSAKIKKSILIGSTVFVLCNSQKLFVGNFPNELKVPNFLKNDKVVELEHRKK